MSAKVILKLSGKVFDSGYPMCSCAIPHPKPPVIKLHDKGTYYFEEVDGDRLRWQPYVNKAAQ